MPRSTKSKASATGVAKSAKGQATAMAASSKAKKVAAPRRTRAAARRNAMKRPGGSLVNNVKRRAVKSALSKTGTRSAY